MPEPESGRRLAAQLEQQITSSALSPGQKLDSERVLAERHGVSRPVVREVLRGLADRKLVNVQPGKGTFVAVARSSDWAESLDLAARRLRVSARQLVEVRGVLECQAAMMAAERAEAEDVRTIWRAHEGFEMATGPVEKVRWDLAFHMAISYAAQNPLLSTMLGALSTLNAELMFRSLTDPNVARAGAPYHLTIAEAIDQKDPDRARNAMQAHLSVAERTYGEDFDRDLNTVVARQLRGLFGQEQTLEDFISAMAEPPAQGDGLKVPPHYRSTSPVHEQTAHSTSDTSADRRRNSSLPGGGGA